MHTAIDVVKSIKSVNDKHVAFQKLNSSDQLKQISAFVDSVLDQWGALCEIESEESGVPRDYLQEFSGSRVLQISEYTRSFSANTEEGNSIGVCAVFLPSVVSMETLAKHLVAGLLSQNAMVFKFSSRSARLYDRVMSSNFFQELPVELLIGDEKNVGSILSQHPGVHSVSFVGTHENFKKIKIQHDKKYLYMSGGSNAAIVLADADLSLAAKDVASSFAFPLWPESVSRVFVVAKVYQEFREKLLEELKSIDCQLRETEINLQRNKDILKTLDSETSCKRQIRQRNFELVEDLTFCSEIHQSQVNATVHLLSEVKYPHEAITWANTTPYRYRVSIYSADEKKYDKFATRLQFSEVYLNKIFSKAIVEGEILCGSGKGPTGVNNLREHYRHKKVVSI